VAAGESTLPLYRRIADDLSTAISGGAYADGRGLPSENELAGTYGVSRGTVRQAFAHLRGTGVVSSRQGARRRAQEAQRLQPMTELLSFSRWARSIGETPSSRTLEVSSGSAPPEVVAALGEPAGGTVLHVQRVRLLGGTPTMVEDTFYPMRLEPLIRPIDLDRESITECLERGGVVLARAEHQIDAVAATGWAAELLEVQEGSPLLRTTRRTTDLEGRPVEHSVDLYRGEAVAFVVRNSATTNTTARITPPGSR
jgi:GntR family transcriptional regulator